jgi:predicted RNA-binding protein with PUA-like domain
MLCGAPLYYRLGAMKHWLVKSEPSVFSIDDLHRDKTTAWEGIRNYQARNFMMKDMAEGDQVLFYHSNAEPPGVAGTATVSSKAHPDATALDKKSDYFDPKASRENPIWYCVDIQFHEKFSKLVSLDDIRKKKILGKMLLLRKGQRLSVQPITKAEFDVISQMGKA